VYGKQKKEDDYMGKKTGKSLTREEGKYVYCVIPHGGKSINFGNKGIGNSGEVYTIPYKEMSAVVSDTALTDYQPTEENIKAHNEVVNLVMKEYTVIPMTFGMGFRDKKVLLSVLEKSYDVIKKTLKLFDNKVELGIKIVLGKELMELLDGERRSLLASHIFESLKRRAVESVNGKLFSKRLLLNASFLVEKDKVDEFSKEVEKAKKMIAPKVQYTGPWPPYNFVKIKIGKGD